MNQEIVKKNLLKLHNCKEDFNVVFTGKKSKKVNGLYIPEKNEILIHNKNFIDEVGNSNNDLMFHTAIHELAHHIMYTEYKKKGVKSHTALFYATLDDLLEIAEKRGVYKIEIDEETREIVEKVKDLSNEIAKLQRELGQVLLKLHATCQRKGIRYEEVVERKAQISKKLARNSIKASQTDMPSKIGIDVQEEIIKTNDNEKQKEILNNHKNGKSINQIKNNKLNNKNRDEDNLDMLVKEKNRIEKTINTLNIRLNEIIEQLKIKKRSEAA